MKIKKTVIAAAAAAAVSAIAIGVPAASAAPTAKAAATPPATTADLRVWLGLGPGGAAAGSTYYPLEFTNISGHSVTIRGFPGVSAIDGDEQLGSPADWNHASPPVTVTLANGATAHTTLQISNPHNFPDVRIATASGLRIYPPNQTTSTTIDYSFEAIAEEGPIYLHVTGPIQPGTGIPGMP